MELLKQILNNRINRYSWLYIIINVLSAKRSITTLLVFSSIYGILYMVSVGVISYIPDLKFEEYPLIGFTKYGIYAIITPNVYFFILYQALAFLILSSFLVGLNLTLIFHARRNKMCPFKLKLKGVSGSLPALFTSFSCCSNGLLAIAIGNATFSYLSLYSQYMAYISIAMLAIVTYLISRYIAKTGVVR